MTDDELDLLASAFLDGEATPDEVALVERDSALQARVAELRAVDLGIGRLPAVASSLKETQLATARQAFEQEVAIRNESAVAVAAAGSSAQEAAGADRVSAPGKWWQSVPSWLPATAAFLILGGGVVALINQSGGDESLETALDASADEAATFSNEATDGEAEMRESFESEIELESVDAAADATSDAMSDASTEDESAEEDMAGSSVEAVPDFPTAETTTTDLVSEPLVLSEIPTSLVGLIPGPLNDPQASPCFEFILEEPVVIEGFVPALLDQEPVEVWVIQRGLDPERKPLTVDSECVILEP